MNFISSITLQFRDAFSTGFTSAQNSFAGMKGALDEINQNQSMNRLAADLAMASSLTEPFRQKLSALMDEPSRLAGTFESSMKNIQAITGLTSAEIKTLGDELRQIGSRAAAGPLAVADAYNDVAGGITNLEAQMPVLNNAIALAEAGQANLGTATNGLVKIMNSYNFTASKAVTETERIAEINGRAAWASDVMTQAVGMGVGSMEEFISAMAPVSGVASVVGVGFDEIGSTMAYMTATTDTAATAGTKLQAFMLALQRPSDALAKALASVGITSGSAMLAEYGLAESANIVSRAFGGNQDAMVQAMGRMEAVKAVMSLMGDTYSEFAAEFGAGMKGITATAQAIQVESYESKVGRLNAATDALKLQVGDDINAIKGFFVDMGAGFLNYVAAPIMSSPVGGFFQGLSAVVGLTAQTVLSLGSGALNTATQLVTLTATIQNAGGFAKLFGSAIGGLASPLKNIGASIAGMIGPLIAKTTATFAATTAELGFAGAMWVTAGAIWAATWPILAIVAAVAALAVGGYMLVKHWDAVSAFFVNLWNKITGAFSAAFSWIKNLLAGTSDWVLGAVAVFLPFIGIPALIIKHWDGIKAFFVGLWVQVSEIFTGVWSGIAAFFSSVWNNIVTTFVEAWNGLTAFFVSVWNSITGVVAGVANWFGEVWNAVTGAFASAWMWIKDLFTSVWESIKGVVMGFVEWLQPVIDVIIAPFKAIGNVIGGIINTVGGWFGNTVETGKTKLAEMSENRVKNAAATPVENSVVPSFSTGTSAIAVPAIPASTQTITAPALPASTQTVTAPALDEASVVPAATISTGMSGGDNSLITEHIAAASRKGIAGSEISISASDAFMSAGTSIAPGIDISDYENEAKINFSEAMPVSREPVAMPWNQPEKKPERKDRPSFNIQNLYLQADDIKEMYDLYRQLEMVFFRPEEAVV